MKQEEIDKIKSFGKKGDRVFVQFTKFNEWTGKPKTEEIEIDIRRLEDEILMHQNEIKEAQKKIKRINLLLNKINVWEKKKKNHDK